jgi:hypothetical protein
MQQVYKIGQIEVTQQAFLILLAGTTLSGLIFLGSLFFLRGMTAKMAGLIVSLIAFGLTCYTGYLINCTIVGKCNNLAWFLVVTYGLVIAAYAIQFFVLFKSVAKLPASSKK